MPQGVEHQAVLDGIGMMVCVRIPLMPQGVEHLSYGRIFNMTDLVRIPLMPQGVEHEQELTCRACRAV